MDHDEFIACAGQIMVDQVFEHEGIVDKQAPVPLTYEKLRMYLAGAYAMGMKHGGVRSMVERIFSAISEDDSPRKTPVDTSKLH